jgi:hypothetical protein
MTATAADKALETQKIANVIREIVGRSRAYKAAAAK